MANDPLEAAVDRISAESGTLFVVAAGNDGPEATTIGSPGSAASALTVGAVDRKDGIAEFSSVGPTADGSLKPDLTAPGVDIVAAKAAKGVEGTPASTRLRVDVRYVDGDPARGRRGGDPRAAAPGLDRGADQAGADLLHRARRPSVAVPAGHRADPT